MSVSETTTDTNRAAGVRVFALTGSNWTAGAPIAALLLGGTFPQGPVKAEFCTIPSGGVDAIDDTHCDTANATTVTVPTTAPQGVTGWTFGDLAAELTYTVPQAGAPAGGVAVRVRRLVDKLDIAPEDDETHLTASELQGPTAMESAAVVAIPATVAVSETTLTVKAGATGTYTLTPGAAPTGDVVVTPTSSNTDTATVSGPVTLTAASTAAQTVTVTAKRAGTATITHTVTTSADARWPAGMTIDTVAVTVTADPPGLPQSVAAAPKSGAAGSLEVTWTAPASDGGADISAYRVRWRTAQVGTQGDQDYAAAGDWQDADGNDNTGQDVGDVTSYTISGLNAGTAYDVSVAATNSVGTGSFATAVQATPAALIVLTITPKQTTRVYGTAQDLGFTVGGLIDGDSATDVLSGSVLTRSGSGDDVGSYTLSFGSLAVEAAFAGKYALPTAPASTAYSITKKAVTYTSSAADKAYDGTNAAPSALGGSFSPALVEGDDVDVTGGTYASTGVGTAIAISGRPLRAPTPATTPSPSAPSPATSPNARSPSPTRW